MRAVIPPYPSQGVTTPKPAVVSDNSWLRNPRSDGKSREEDAHPPKRADLEEVMRSSIVKEQVALREAVIRNPPRYSKESIDKQKLKLVSSQSDHTRPTTKSPSEQNVTQAPAESVFKPLRRVSLEPRLENRWNGKLLTEEGKCSDDSAKMTGLVSRFRRSYEPVSKDSTKPVVENIKSQNKYMSNMVKSVTPTGYENVRRKREEPLNAVVGVRVQPKESVPKAENDTVVESSSRLDVPSKIRDSGDSMGRPSEEIGEASTRGKHKESIPIVATKNEVPIVATKDEVVIDPSDNSTLEIVEVDDASGDVEDETLVEIEEETLIEEVDEGDTLIEEIEGDTLVDEDDEGETIEEVVEGDTLVEEVEGDTLVEVEDDNSDESDEDENTLLALDGDVNADNESSYFDENASFQARDKGDLPGSFTPFSRKNKFHESISSSIVSPAEFGGRRVILDFAAMEPPSPVRRQHLKVIEDIEKLIKRTKEEFETEKQKTMKEKTLQELVHTSKHWREFLEDYEKPMPDLTMDEVTDIVNHITTCEKSNLPVRWDLINDIVFPDGGSQDSGAQEANQQQAQEIQKPPQVQWEVPENAAADDAKQETAGTGERTATQNYLLSVQPTEREVRRRRLSSRLMNFGTALDESNNDILRDRETAKALRGETGLTEAEMDDVLDHWKAVETFRRQYELTEDDMANLIAHLNLCEETNSEVRWDLIHRIIYPDDHLSLPPLQTKKEFSAEVDDCHSAVTEGFDDGASNASWFSIYPDFDDCASSVTFLVDGDDVKVGKKSKKPKRDSKQSIGRGTIPFLGTDKRRVGKTMPMKQTSGRNEALLRKRVAVLRGTNNTVRNLEKAETFLKVFWRREPRTPKA